MGYLALLFCPDEKTARTVTNVLNELEFSVEPCTEPFAAVKKLMAQHFDAVVVDCDNEQNATLLFKSARNSASNQSSLAVAVVEGQAGVAKAFRIGANLVLTKPINVEQAKGTLRVARGLLRKGAEAKAPAKPATSASSAAPQGPAAPVASTPVPPVAPTRTAPTPAASSFAKPAPKATPAPTQPKRPPVAPPAPPVPVQTASVEDHEPDSILDDNDLYDLPSSPLPQPPTPAASAPSAGTSKFPWQPAKPMAEPMGTALRKAAEAAAKIENENSEFRAKSAGLAPVEEHPPASTGVSFHASASASAPAPAKEKAPLNVPPTIIPPPMVPPPIAPEPIVKRAPPLQVSEIRIEEAPAKEEEKESPYYTSSDSDGESAPPTFFPGAYDPDEAEGGSKVKAIVIVAMVALLACSAAYLSWRNMSGKGSPVSSPSQTTAPATATAKPEGGETSQKQEPESAGSEVSDIRLGGASSTPPAKPSATKPATKQAAPEPEPAQDTEPEVTQRLIVHNESPRAAKPAAPPEQENVQAPSVALGAAPDTKALAGLSSAASTPTAPAQVVKVSQGVMEGLILKRVQPRYPAQAMQMRIQGAVQLQATINKAGDITNLKVVSGDGILGRAAQEAVKQWKYKPYYLNGEPVEIQTQILVNFKLPN